MPKTTLVVPHWPLFPENEGMLKRCIQSIPADEKIIIVNEGTGMGKAINKGLELSTGDFIIVSNNDCYLTSGDIQDLCDPEAITLPDNMPGNSGDVPRAFYCMPRTIYQQIGGYDEQFTIGYFEDDDLIERWRQAGIPFKMTRVQVAHNPGSTLDKMPNRNVIFEENRKRFIAKWGHAPNEE